MLLFGVTGDDEGSSIGLTWDGGALKVPLGKIGGQGDIGETVWLLQGSRIITDWESRYRAWTRWRRSSSASRTA